MIRIWKFAYDRWYDNKAAGNTLRARFWGFIVDVTANFA